MNKRPSLKVDTQGREKLIPLAPGAVHPTGWVRRLAQIEADNWMEMVVQKDDYNLRKSLYDGSETIAGGEWAGYWNDSFIGLSLVLGNEDRLKRVNAHIEEILAGMEKRQKLVSEWYSGWGSHLQVRALMTWYEATGDTRVLDLCHRIALELLDDLNYTADDPGRTNPMIDSSNPDDIVQLWRGSHPKGHKFDGDHPVNMASSCVQLYGYTGDERLLDMAIEIMRRFDAYGLPNLQRLLNDDRLYGHCVNYCEDIRHPADVYLFSGNPDHLKASKRGVELTNRDHMQVHGVPTGNEPVNGKGPMKETEHCDAVEWSLVGHSLLQATGDVEYADLSEKVFFNAWIGSRKWDGKSLCYNHAPNQLTASSWEGEWTPRQNYSAFHQPQCCNLNSHRALHPYANRMWMLTPDEYPAAVYYGDCELKVNVPGVGEVEFTEKTAYPFDENVSITVNPESVATFPISLRIPGWCESAEVSVNGKKLDSPKSGSFYTIDREWWPGDRIDLKLPMPVKLEWCKTFEEPALHDSNHLDYNRDHTTQIALRLLDDPIPGKHLVAVTRGPLTYTLYIKHRAFTEPVENEVEGYPIENFVPADDALWNVALVLNGGKPEDSFEFVKLDVGDSAPFERAPVGLKCKARVMPEWKAAGTPDKPMTTLPDFPYEALGEEVEALLVPFGCTRIRLTWLPFVL